MTWNCQTKCSWGTFLAIVALTGFATSWSTEGGPLEYAQAPPDNPLRGLVPYVSASGKDRFPHSMEFCYFALSELMPGSEQFNWQPIEEILAEVNGRGNQLIFRVYCEYPGRELAVPEFLVDAGVPVIEWNNAAEQQVSFTPDYENHTLREAMADFIRALGTKYDGDPRVAFIAVGLLGSWGEWHNYPRDDLWASKEVQREIMDSYTAAFTNTKLLLRYPAGPDSYWHAENHERPFGYHDDSFSWATLGTGKAEDSWFFETSMEAAGATEKWRNFPIGGEIRPELWTSSFTSQRHPRDQGFIDCVERLHVTWLMDSGLFDPRIPMDVERKNRAHKEVARMGYELHISDAHWTGKELNLTVMNLGVAPFYYDWPVEIEVGGEIRKTDWKLSGILPDAPRTWSMEMAEKVEIRLRIPNPMKGGKPVRFANRYQGKEWLVIRP
ncbi:MAG: hypothetical protein AAGA96_15460 [Verrucomicrobiota bacterium]